MHIFSLAGRAVFLLLELFFLVFVISSLVEKEYRAFRRSTAVFCSLAALGFGIYFVSPPAAAVMFPSLFILFLAALLAFLLLPQPKEELKVAAEMEKIDERDVIFARFDLEKNSSRFQEYYRRKPEYFAGDEEIRKWPDLFEPEHIQKDPVALSLGDVEFEFLEHQMTIVDGEVDSKKHEQSKPENMRMVKSLLKYLGADLSGICRLEAVDIYSHVGRGPEQYGSDIQNSHDFGIAFAVEMQYDMIRHAPRPPVVVETAKQYVEAARISIILAALIRRLGYSARAHIAGSNYQAMLVPCAWRAGLGELGRMGILMTKPFGPRVRLGLVTTSLPLETDKPAAFGVQSFCRKCLKCARNCPAQAIPLGEKVNENGVLKWVINRENCYAYWRRVGTDCSTCIYVCPYSKPNNFFHNLIRFLASRSAPAQSLAAAGDDFFYGRRPQTRLNSPLSK